MSEPLLIRRILFGLAVGAALLLLLLVLAAPWFDDTAHDSRDAVALFARDATLRRTSIASAVGLIVTACVFFRRRRLPSPPPRPPSSNAGA
jgi:hypothetical protein